ncbi:FadR/GntR family transcriptional regulator [Amycolatopsis sp.]|uniref:FadR/GntR family transcriptional regulator n=1 Tax=Amycolatopsis sp. TaxID=37632 RepID=UPI002C3F0C18|nr:FadR/GntR family transcriptional regulator [Amycolatopsis sp.]HVV14070.1 FadR/GntR family transcriptional regulator [Amycolatopsis sp.]
MPSTESPHRRTRGVGVELAARLERMIATGEFGPGSRLPGERDLATSLEVSRASVREALQHLEAKNLVERVHGRGTIVLPPPEQVTELYEELTDTAKELAHIAELRVVVEPRIAEFAALRATGPDLRQLADILARSHERLSTAQSLQLDVEFHLALARASQNPLLNALNTLASSWTSDVRSHSHATREGRRISCDGHRAIYDAVLARDGDAAAAAMTRHLADVELLVRKAARRAKR